jgi:hypothetical protein
MLVVLLVSLIVSDTRWLALGYLVPILALAVAHVSLLVGNALVRGVAGSALQRVRLHKASHRAYVMTVLAAAGSWSIWSQFGGWRPYLTLPLITTLVAWPWFKRASVKKTIPITISPELTAAARNRAQARANTILAGWPVITRQGRIQLSELDGLEFTTYTMIVDVTLRGGQGPRSLMYPVGRVALESAFDAPNNSLRVMERGSRAREVRLVFVMEDVNAEGLGVPPAGDDSMGRFETADPVRYVDGVHTVIAGANGSGKSGLMNRALQRKGERSDWAVLGIDLKPGAVEFTPWAPVLAYLADTPEKVTRILDGLLTEMDWRGAEMKRRGLRKWIATPEHPNICLAIDEVQELHRVKGAMKTLTRLAQLARAFGFELVLATQFPKDSNLPSDIMSQIRQIFCCRLAKPSDDRVVFGELATAQGFTPSAIPDGMGGVFFIKSAQYQAPIRARGWWLGEKDVPKIVAGLTRTPLNRPWVPQAQAATFEALSGPETAYQLARADEYEDDIVEAVVVSESPVETVLDAIRAGHGVPDAIVDSLRGPDGKPTLSKRAVNNILKDLADQGRIAREGQRATANRPWIVME